MARAHSKAESNSKSKRSRSPRKGGIKEQVSHGESKTRSKQKHAEGPRKESLHNLSREDVLALGGDDDDLELLKDIDSDNDGKDGRGGNEGSAHVSASQSSLLSAL